MPERESSQKPTILDRALNIVADVNAGEGLGAVVLLAAIFLILCAYYVLKTAREGLILSGGTFGLPGDELKIYAGGVMAVLMLGLVPAYGRLASRVNRKRLLEISYALVVVSLAVFFVLGNAGVGVGLPFFVWLGIVSMFLIAQFWSFANDLYTEEQGKRLFAIIAIGGTAGAIVGPKLTGLADTFGMMAIAAGMLLVTVILLGVVDKIARGKATPHETAATDAPLAKDGGFQLVLRDRYLFLIAVMLILANLVNTTGEFILSNAAKEYATDLVPASQFADIVDADKAKQALEKARGKVIGEFYADFFFWVNLVGFLIQTLLASRIIKYAGLRVALFVLPAIALGGYGAIGLVGGLALLRVAKVAENGTDYSLQNTVRQALFLPTSREVKYKAKAAIDTFFVRFGDTAAALLVLFGIHQLGFGRTEFALVNAGIIVLWLAVAFGIARRHKRIETQGKTVK